MHSIQNVPTASIKSRTKLAVTSSRINYGNCEDPDKIGSTVSGRRRTRPDWYLCTSPFISLPVYMCLQEAVPDCVNSDVGNPANKFPYKLLDWGPDYLISASIPRSVYLQGMFVNTVNAAILKLVEIWSETNVWKIYIYIYTSWNLLFLIEHQGFSAFKLSKLPQ